MIFEFGKRLIAARKKHHLSQEQAAVSLNIARSTLCDYEREVIQPSIDLLVQMATLYGTSVDYLMGLKKDESISLKSLSDEEKNILLEIDNLLIKLLNSD